MPKGLPPGRLARNCYSMTSSARARIVSGIVSPSTLAVVRLITSSNLVGCSTGRFTGGVDDAKFVADVFSGTIGNTGVIDFGPAPVLVAATPLPAALPLFATGLGALGLLGWRRKRKAANGTSLRERSPGSAGVTVDV
jgi:hypothetical protein